MTFSQAGKTVFSRHCWRLEILGPLFALGITLSPVLASTPPSASYSVIDALDSKVEFAKPPARIITLAPSLAELVASLGDNFIPKIIGVSEYTDYPATLSKVASIGPYNRVNLEKIITLKPDLVLATTDGNIIDQIKLIRSAKIPVVVVKSSSIREIAQSIEIVAAAVGSPKGPELARSLTKAVEDARLRSALRPKVKTLLQLGDQPLIVVGSRAFLHEVLEASGGINVFADLNSPYPRPSIETALVRDPDAILVLSVGPDAGEFEAMVKSWKKFPKLKAVKNNRVEVLRSDELIRPSLRLIQGLAALERALHAPR